MKTKSARANTLNMFAELGLVLAPLPTERAEPEIETESVNPRPSAREEHRGRVMIETMLRCFSNPTIYCEQPTSAVPPPHEWLKKHRMLIELERAARLMKLVKRKPDASLDEIRVCALTLTNPEKAGVLSVISGIVPPSHEQGAEYLRAFAHCEEMETILKLFGDMNGDVIPLSDVERFYQLYGGVSATRAGEWGYLDDEERHWICDFNKKVRDAKTNNK